MPSTYTSQDAVNIVTAYIKGIPTTAINIQTCDIVNSMIWTSFTWRWTLSSLTPIALVDGVQDYAVANTDYYRLARARLVRTDTTPDEFYELLTSVWVAPDLTKSGYTGITAIAYEQALAKLRITRAIAISAGSTFEIQGEYQRAPVKITSLSTVLPFPDHYFPAFVDGLLWKCYQFADDSRAGQMLVRSDGTRTYTGQMGAFYSNLFAMAEAEDWGQGDTAFPDNPLGVSGGYGVNPLFFT